MGTTRRVALAVIILISSVGFDAAELRLSKDETMAAKERYVYLLRSGDAARLTAERRLLLERAGCPVDALAGYPVDVFDDTIVRSVISVYRSILLTHPTGPRDTYHLEIIERARRIGITDVELGLAKPKLPSVDEELDWIPHVLEDGPSTEQSALAQRLAEHPLSERGRARIIQAIPRLQGAALYRAFQALKSSQDAVLSGILWTWVKSPELSRGVRQLALGALGPLELYHEGLLELLKRPSEDPAIKRLILSRLHHRQTKASRELALVLAVSGNVDSKLRGAAVRFVGNTRSLTGDEARSIREVALNADADTVTRLDALGVLRAHGQVQYGDDTYLRIIRDEDSVLASRLRRELADYAKRRGNAELEEAVRRAGESRAD